MRNVLLLPVEQLHLKETRSQPSICWKTLRQRVRDEEPYTPYYSVKSLFHSALLALPNWAGTILVRLVIAFKLYYRANN